MNFELKFLIERLQDNRINETSVFQWGSPIPSFGNVYKSSLATLGLNPSNREFVDSLGKELDGVNRRFHSLNSLDIASWNELDEELEKEVLDACLNYFYIRPYDAWFKKLDFIISGLGYSYYFPLGNACHLDLIPFATSKKWSEISAKEKSLLLELSGDTLGILLKASPIHTLVLNGITVVDNFNKVSNSELEKKKIASWTLPRTSGSGVEGFSYKGVVSKIGKIDLEREILVLGYNHNIQSSYGVTTKVMKSIRSWVEKNGNHETR